MFVALTPIGALATTRWQVKSWTTDTALPQGVVYAIHQTRDGYLWLTTLGGLVRYDGIEFTTFSRATTKGLRSSRFTCLFEAPDGTLRAGTEDGFVTTYRNGTFRTTSVDGSLAAVLAIGANDSGTVMAWTTRGLFALERNHFVRRSAAVESRAFAYRTGFAAVTLRGVAILEADRAPRSLPFARPLSTATHFLGSDGKVLWIVEDDRAWLYRDGQLTPVDHPGLRRFLRSPHGALTAITQAADGAFWVGDSTHGVARIDDSGVEWITPRDGLCSLAVARIYEDRARTIWIASLGGGISEIHQRAARTWGEAEGLRPPNVFPIIPFEGGLVAGSWGGGVYRFDGNHFEPGRPTEGAVMSLADGGDGSLWVSVNSHPDGLQRIRGGEARTFGPDDGINAVVRAIFRDRQGRVWFGTNDGLALLTAAERFLTFRTRAPDTNFIQTIAEDRDGSLLLGTRGGVLRFRDRHFSTVADERSGLGSNAVRALLVGGDGTIWIGTYDGGLHRLRHGQLRAITTREGLFDDGVFAILEDQGYFWMSSNRGIHRVSIRELNAVADGEISAVSSLALTRDDGLLSPECNGGIQPAAARTADGLLWFPTQQGLVSIDPTLVRTASAPPSVLMTSVAIDGDEIPATGEIRMLPDNNRVEFRFAAPTTVGARLIRYRYRLEGFDSRWNEIVGARVATYTRVPPGHYRFVVSASNASGLWSQTPAIVMLRVLPPFWRTWWFIGLTCAAAISALAFAYRLRIRTIERKQAAQAEFSRQLLTQQEEERKRVASELHDSLGQSLLIIRNRALLAIDRQVASDEELTEISETASAAIDEVRRIAHHLRPVELDHLGLRGSLVALVRRLSASTTILFRGDFDDVDEVLQSDAQVNLFRIVQEWTSNIVRHSDATAAFISLERDGRRLRMRITDDGSGFSYVDGARRARTGIGLRSIEERVQMLKGTLDIQSTPGEGTALTIEWSLPEAE